MIYMVIGTEAFSIMLMWLGAGLCLMCAVAVPDASVSSRFVFVCVCEFSLP